MLTAERRSIYNSGHHVNAESLRDVHVLLLLLCMRVLWRREAAEVKGFLLKPALITHRQMNLAVGFLFSGTKQSGDKKSGQYL